MAFRTFFESDDNSYCNTVITSITQNYVIGKNCASLLLFGLFCPLQHTNCIPLCHYRRLLDGDLFYLNLIHQLPPPPSSLNPNSDLEKKQKPQNGTKGINPAPIRHPHSFAQCRDTTNHEDAITVVHKSASCNSAPTAAMVTFKNGKCLVVLRLVSYIVLGYGLGFTNIG